MSFQLRDPVHGFIRLSRDEVELIDSRAVQRLRGIRQLAMADLVYPGALHTRFDHSLGVAHVAGQMAAELGFDPDEVELVRLGGLLHDVGHGPFSHVSEQALEMFADRSTLTAGQKREKIHELVSARLIQTDRQVVKLLGEDKCQRIAKLLSEGHGHPALRSILSGPLDADKQDYLLRDSLFCGVPYGVFDIHQMHRSLMLRGKDASKELMIDPNGIHAVEQYVLAKYYLTTNVYRHKVRLITDQMIVRAIVLGIEKDRIDELRRLYRYDGTDEFVSNYAQWDDSRFMQRFGRSREKTRCRELLERLRQRRLLKMVFRESVKKLPPVVRDVLPVLMEPERASRRKRAALEKAIAAGIAKASGQKIDPDLVIVNIFSIRNAREMSKNDEAGILVGSDEPEPFEKASTLFASIRERMADEFVEVYAPVEWPTLTDRAKIRQNVREPVLGLLEGQGG